MGTFSSSALGCVQNVLQAHICKFSTMSRMEQKMIENIQQRARTTKEVLNQVNPLKKNNSYQLEYYTFR